ncbi:MAG: zinc ribbon domain-containing protein, partial [Syntrophales bacterium]
MTEWLKQVEPLTLKGQIAVPYTWWVGETGSKFLVSIRDHQKILGTKCQECGTVYVPPRKNCGR